MEGDVRSPDAFKCGSFALGSAIFAGRADKQSLQLEIIAKILRGDFVTSELPTNGFDKERIAGNFAPDQARHDADMRLELAQAKAREKELQADMEVRNKISREKTEKLDALEERVARLTSIRPDDKAMVLAEKNTAALQQLDDCCNAVWQAVLQLCAQGSAILTNEDSTDETCSMVHGRVSALAEIMTDALTRSGIDVDLSAYLQMGTPAAADVE